MGIPIPEDVQARLKAKNFWHLATLKENGAPQSTPVWADTDGTYVIINTAKGRAKDQHMRRDGRVALSSFELDNPYDFVEIQGRVAEIIEGQPAEDGIDDFAEKYMGQRPYPLRKPGEQRVIFKIEPTAFSSYARSH
jgi:PPOX class probable F420-dependent enzyme